LGTHRLAPHPDFPPRSVRGVEVQWVETGSALRLRYRVDGHEDLVIPPFAGRGRADELWRTTCFELYLQHQGDTGYAEFNFSPSQRWAAYDFEDYRSGMRPRPLSAEPVGEAASGERLFVQDVLLDTAPLPPRPWAIGLSAILEEADGTISYWALGHGVGRPDFHHPDGWMLTDSEA
jgi:hypothetical protein